jgi:hypothetical protein
VAIWFVDAEDPVNYELSKAIVSDEVKYATWEVV